MVMKMMSKAKTGLDLLQDVLDAYGGDRTRWPAHARLELSQLLSMSPEARKMLTEAQALDRLLDLAPSLPKDRVAALSARILAEASHSPRVVVNTAAARLRPPVMTQWRRFSAGAAALAASLMIGVLAGQSSTLAPAMSEIANVAGLATGADSQQFAQFDDTESDYEEAL